MYQRNPNAKISKEREVITMSTFFLHKEQITDPDFVDADIDVVTVHEFCATHSESNAKAQLWLQDADQPLNPTLTLKDAGAIEDCHVILAECEKIQVTLNHNAATRTLEVAPSTTLRKVFEQAVSTNYFNLTDQEKTGHELIQVENEDITMDSLLGTLTINECAVVLDLVPTHRFQG